MSGLTPDFGSNQPTASASFANPLAPMPTASQYGQGLYNAGSQIWNNSGADALFHSSTGTQGQDLSNPTAYASGPNQNYSPAPTSSPTNYSNGSGNTPSVPSQFNQPGGFGNPNSPDLSNSYKQGLYNQYHAFMSSQQNAAAANASYNIQAAVNQYNQLKSQLELQRPGITSAYQTGSADLNNQLQLGQQQGQANQSLLTNQYTQGQGQMGQQYQQSEAQNRELARAVGGNGSDYGQLQNLTHNSYMNNAAQAYNDYSSRSQQISQGLQSLQNWGASQQHGLATQYNQAIGQLSLDENMTDIQKAQQISKIQSDYSNQLASINSVVAQFGNQLSLAKAQVDTTAMMFGRSIQGYDPLSNMAQMFYGSLGQQAPTVDASGGITQPNQNKTAGGVNTNQNSPVI